MAQSKHVQPGQTWRPEKVTPLEKFRLTVVPIKQASWPKGLRDVDLYANQLLPWVYPEIVQALPDRDTARALGLRYYRSGPCKYGHEHGVRLVNSWKCVECQKITTEHPENRAAVKARNDKKNGVGKQLIARAREVAGGKPKTLRDFARDPDAKSKLATTREDAAERGHTCYWGLHRSGVYCVVDFDRNNADDKRNKGKRRRRVHMQRQREQDKRSYQKRRREVPEIYKALKDKGRALYRARRLLSPVIDPTLNWDRPSGETYCQLTGWSSEFGVEGRWDIDHVWPLVEGGSHTVSNIRPTHDSANRSKNSGLPLTRLFWTVEDELVSDEIAFSNTEEDWWRIQENYGPVVEPDDRERFFERNKKRHVKLLAAWIKEDKARKSLATKLAAADSKTKDRFRRYVGKLRDQHGQGKNWQGEENATPITLAELREAWRQAKK